MFKTASLSGSVFGDSGPASGVRRRDYRGLWVALENCRYDGETGRPIEGNVVDFDPQFASLSARMRQSGRCSCAIVFCDENFCLESHDAPALS